MCVVAEAEQCGATQCTVDQGGAETDRDEEKHSQDGELARPQSKGDGKKEEGDAYQETEKRSEVATCEDENTIPSAHYQDHRRLERVSISSICRIFLL